MMMNESMQEELDKLRKIAETRSPVPTRDDVQERDQVAHERISCDSARDLVESALKAYAERWPQGTVENSLAEQLAENVKGWTHTTRLREYLNNQVVL